MERLFWTDPYMSKFETEVVEVLHDRIALKATAFYAESGGQAGDTGQIDGERVKDTRYNSQRDEIYHFLDDRGGSGKFKEGMLVSAEIDWDRRYNIMRLHSALHIVFLAFEKLYGTVKVMGSQVRCDKARVDFSHFDKVDAADVADAVNEIILTHSDIVMSSDPSASSRRYWTIGGGYESIPCGGTHVSNTREIGTVKVKRKSLGSQGVRLYCSLA